MTKDEIFAELELETEEVPFAKGTVKMTALPAEEFIALWNDERCQREGKTDLTLLVPLLICRGALDADGKPIFADEDAVRVGRGTVRKFMALAAAARRLNGIGGTETKN